MGVVRRLRSVAIAIAPQPAPAAAVEAEIATNEPVDVAELPPTLLSDSQVVSFITRGYVMLPLTEFSASFHAGVHEESERLYHMAGDKGGAVSDACLCTGSRAGVLTVCRRCRRSATTSIRRSRASAR